MTTDATGRKRTIRHYIDEINESLDGIDDIMYWTEYFFSCCRLQVVLNSAK